MSLVTRYVYRTSAVGTGMVGRYGVVWWGVALMTR